MRKHFIGGTLADFTWDLSKISISDSHVSYANLDAWDIILNVWKVLIKILEGTFCQTPLWLNLSSKFSIWCNNGKKVWRHNTYDYSRTPCYDFSDVTFFFDYHIFCRIDYLRLLHAWVTVCWINLALLGNVHVQIALTLCVV